MIRKEEINNPIFGSYVYKMNILGFCYDLSDIQINVAFYPDSIFYSDKSELFIDFKSFNNPIKDRQLKVLINKNDFKDDLDIGNLMHYCLEEAVREYKETVVNYKPTIEELLKNGKPLAEITKILESIE